MDRYNYQNQISEILDETANELSSEEFQILLSRIEDMINDNYE